MRSSQATRRLFQAAYRLLTGYNHPLIIYADNAKRLLGSLDWIDDDVPPRSQRTHQHQDHKEWFCLRRYLAALARHERLVYPFTVRKGESPDFLFRWPDGALTGLEITEATTEDFQRELTATEGSGKASPSGPPDGWAGDEVEEGLAELTLRSLDRKAELIGRCHFNVAKQHDLLIYDNSEFIAPAKEALRWILQETLAGYPAAASSATGWPCGPLGRVSLLTGDTLLYDLGGEGAVLPCGPLPA